MPQTVCNSWGKNFSDLHLSLAAIINRMCIMVQWIANVKRIAVSMWRLNGGECLDGDDTFLKIASATCHFPTSICFQWNQLLGSFCKPNAENEEMKNIFFHDAWFLCSWKIKKQSYFCVLKFCPKTKMKGINDPNHKRSLIENSFATLISTYCASFCEAQSFPSSIQRLILSRTVGRMNRQIRG